MPTLTVKNIPDELYERLKQSAGEHRRSLNSEILVCLERALYSERVDPQAVLARADAERILRGADYEVDLGRVLAVAERTGRCALDCEHAALARELGVPYVTADRALAAAMGQGTVWFGELGEAGEEKALDVER